MKKIYIALLLITISHLCLSQSLAEKENEFYQLNSLPIPENVLLEVGGMDFLPDGRLAICTRRGEIWLVDGLYKDQIPSYQLFAKGLHEPLGLTVHNGSIYVTQRAEITKISDSNGDDNADKFETMYTWPLTGNYHEYSYGPKFLPDGSMLVTLNLGWEGKGVSKAKWRGWFLRILPDGRMFPWACGLRSPAGFGFNSEGDLFYAENQGDWVGSGRISHVERGDFLGNPASLRWTQDKLSPLNLPVSAITDSLGTMYQAQMKIEEVKPPAVWFPHGIMGISTADIVTVDTDGQFGPFEGQLLVSDQGQSKIMRVHLEKILGVYQGACFPFREGYASGLIRLTWGKKGKLFGGMTSRGWRSTGPEPFALQRLDWTGKTPFEMKSIKIQPDGFVVEFTKKVPISVLEDISNYKIRGFTYKYHHIYGSPAINILNCVINSAQANDDNTSVHLKVDGLRAGYVHEIKLGNVQAADGSNLLHDVGYYTINRIPGGREYTGEIEMIAGSEGKEMKVKRKRIINMPESWQEIDKEIVINTVPGMKYDKELIEIPAGSKVKLTLNNPDDMQHNLLIVEPGELATVGKLAADLGLEGTATGYIPDTDLVLFHTKLLEPETSESIYFEAPDKPGDYPFVCTVPGHWKTMNGIIRVTKIPGKQQI